MVFQQVLNTHYQEESDVTSFVPAMMLGEERTIGFYYIISGKGTNSFEDPFKFTVE